MGPEPSRSVEINKNRRWRILRPMINILVLTSTFTATLSNCSTHRQIGSDLCVWKYFRQETIALWRMRSIHKYRMPFNQNIVIRMSIPFIYDGQCNFITPKVLHCVTSFPIDLRQYPTTRVNRSRGDWVRLKHFLPKNSYLRFYCEFLRESRINHKLDVSAT